MSKYYESLIGQPQIKTRLDFYVDAFRQTGIFPNTIFIAQKGDGKTAFARKTAEVLKQISAEAGVDRVFAEVNCASIIDADAFIDKMVNSLKQDVHATLFFDEFHALPSKIVNWMLTALETGNEVNYVTHEGEQVAVDFRRFTFIAATTERQKVFLPLLNRFRMLELSHYSVAELDSILVQKCGSPMAPEIRSAFVGLGRGNARSIVDLALEINRFCDIRGSRFMGKDELNELITILDVFPLGLSRAEVNSLLTLQERKEMSLTAFCAASGLTRPAQQNAESYLLRNGLIEIGTNSKRVLTPEGKKYLAKIRGEVTSDVPPSDTLFN